MRFIMSKVTVALIQMHSRHSQEANFQAAIAHIKDAAKKGASIVCLPELFLTDYFCQTHDQAWFDLAEPLSGTHCTRLKQAAAMHDIIIVGSLFEKQAPGLYYNSSVIIEKDGTLKGLYRKMHIPHDPLFYEKYYFAPGDTGFIAVDTSAAKLGPLICWDQWYPEAARLTALQGAEILFYPTAIGWHPFEKAEYGDAQLSAWQTMQRSHAIANGVFVVACNRFGHEIPSQGGDGIHFWGGSFICDPFGRVLAEAGEEEETVLIAECDLSLIEDTRRNWPFLRDRRVDAYTGLTERFNG